MFFAISVCVFGGAGGVCPVCGAKLSRKRDSNVLPPCSRIRFDNVRIQTLFLTDMHKQSRPLFHVNTHNSAS